MKLRLILIYDYVNMYQTMMQKISSIYTDGKAIGQIQLFDFQNNNTLCTIGYFLGRKYWNQGINTRCIKAVSEFAINNMKLERIEAYAKIKPQMVH